MAKPAGRREKFAATGDCCRILQAASDRVGTTLLPGLSVTSSRALRLLCPHRGANE